MKICKLEEWKLKRIQRAERDPNGGKWSNERSEVEVGGSEICQDLVTALFNPEARFWTGEAEMQRQDKEIAVLEREKLLE